MISRYDFADALHLLFESKNAYIETSLDKMKNLTFVFDSRKLIYYFYRCAKFLAVVDNLEALRAKLSSFAIDLSVVFSGVDVFDLAPLLNPAFLFSRFLEKYYYFRMIYKIISDNDIANHNYSINVINIYNRLACDSFVAWIYQSRYQDAIIRVMQRMKIEQVRSLHSSDSHIYLTLRQDPMSKRAVSQPTIFLFSEEQRVISEINFLEDSCIMYDLNLLSQALGCPRELLRKCLLGAFLYFQCSTSKRNELRLVFAMKKPFSEFAEAHLQGDKDNMDLLISIIDRLKNRIQSCDSDEEVCVKVSEVFNLDFREMINLLVKYKRSALVDEVSPSNLTVTSLSLNALSEKILSLWTTKNYLPIEIIRLFSNCSGHTIYFYFPKFECLEISFMYQMYLRDKIQLGAAHIASVVALPKSVQSGTINFFDEEIVSVSFNPIEDDILPFVASQGLCKSAVTFQSELVALFQQLRESKSNVGQFTEKPSVVQALKFVYLSLLRDLLYTNPATKSILIPGAAFIELGEHEFQEEIVFLFELIRSNMIRTKMYRDLPAKSKNNIKIINRNFFDMLMLNEFSFDPFLVKFNYNYVGKSSSRRGNNSSQNSDPLSQVDSIKKVEEADDDSDTSVEFDEKLSEMKFSITPLYKNNKNFMKEYLRFHEGKTEKDVYAILKQSFGDSALGKVLFISRVLTFVVTNYAIPEIFDYDLYQFRELYSVVGKSFQTLMCSYLFYFTSKTSTAMDQEFINQVISALPFRKSYSLDFGILLKILVSKFLIFRTLKATNDPFASVFLAEFDWNKIRAKYDVNFDMIDALDRGKRLFVKLYTFMERMGAYSKNAILTKFTKNLKRSSSLLKEFIVFIQRIPSH